MRTQLRPPQKKYGAQPLHPTVKMPLGMEVGLSPGDFVLDGDTAPPQKGWSLQFSVHLCCGQTAGWIKMALGVEVGLSPSHIVLDGDLAPLPKRGPSSRLATVKCTKNWGLCPF